MSQEVLAVYLQHYPDSAIAINLKACNHFRLYNGKAAEQVRHRQETKNPLFCGNMNGEIDSSGGKLLILGIKNIEPRYYSLVSS